MKSKIIEIALKEYFTHESPELGNNSNPQVLKYFSESGNSWVKDDSANAWCSAFANYVAKTAGLPITGSLLARSWLDAGQPTTKPEIGDYVVFWRDDINSTLGHVSIFIKEDGNNIVCLGGNQNDEVNISRYPKARVLEYRDITLPWNPKPKSLFTRTLSLGSKGDDVKILQKLIGATVDGDFGRKTEDAVKVFQSLHKLKVDGVVGAMTQKVLGTIK